MILPSHHIPRQLRSIYSFIRRGQNGWSEHDAWDLDAHLAKIIWQSIHHVGENSHPPSMTHEEWRSVLDQIAEGYKHYWHGDSDDPGSHAQKKYIVAKKLLFKHFEHLWD